MKVKVDLTRCAGHARCMDEAPAVFGYHPVSNLTYIIKGADIEANRDAIELAIQACPERAISWTVDKAADEEVSEAQG